MLKHYAFWLLNDTHEQVLHNPVTLKLQEEEEEQLLAQCVFGRLSQYEIVTFTHRYYIACAADAKFLILYAIKQAKTSIFVTLQ